MKQLTALLLALCIAMPLCAFATRTRITSYTEEEWALVDDMLWALDERIFADGMDALSPEARLLYIAAHYNGLMLSGGLVSVMLYMEPEYIADIPAALRFVGAEDHAAQLEAFMEETGCDPAALQLLDFLGSSFIRTIHPFEAFDAAFIAMDEETALTTLIYLHLVSAE